MVAYSKVKVILIHTTISPYRQALFEKLSKLLNLTVYYCSVRYGSRIWEMWPRSYGYKYEVLSPRIRILAKGLEELNINLTIAKKLLLNRPRVIIVNGYIDPTMWLGFLMAKLLGIPAVYWTEGIKEPRSIIGILTRPLRTLFIKWSNAIVVPGKLSKNYVISIGAKAENVFVAPNAIDNELFTEASHKYRLHRREFRNRLGLEGKVIILCVSQLIRRKGIEYLLQAYERLRKVDDSIALVLIGSGPYEKDLKKFADRHRLGDLKFVPTGLSQDELIKFYSIADIFVLPTIEDLWGFVINEAMACELPVVSTKASQAAIEMIRNGENGYVVEEADSDELFLVLKGFIGDRRLWAKMGKRSRELVENEFNISRMAEGFFSAVKNCIGDSET